MTNKQFLDKARERNAFISRQVRDKFYFLEDEQLRYSPSPEKWNALECFLHLNHTNAIYLENIRKAVKNARPKPGAEDKKFRQSWLGKRMTRYMDPETDTLLSFKMKTPKNIIPKNRLHPGFELVARVIFEDFMNDQEEARKLMDDCGELQLSKIKIATVLGPLVRINIGDAFEVMNAHNHRHVLQAERTIAT